MKENILQVRNSCTAGRNAALKTRHGELALLYSIVTPIVTPGILKNISNEINILKALNT